MAFPTDSYGIRVDGSLWAFNPSKNLDWIGVTAGPPPEGHKAAPVPGRQWRWVDGGIPAFAIDSYGALWRWPKTEGDKPHLLDWGKNSAPTRFEEFSTWKFISLGKAPVRGTYLAIRDDDTLWVWGDNDRCNIWEWTARPVQLGANDRWLAAYSATRRIVAIREDGTVWFWGDQYSMDCSNTARPLPLPKPLAARESRR